MQRKVISLSCVIVCTLLIVVSLFVWFFYENNAEKGQKAVIYVGSQAVKTLPLSEDTEFKISDADMLIKIENGCAYIKESDCKCKTCIGFGKISKAGQSALCLPNKVTVVIEGEGEIDGTL